MKDPNDKRTRELPFLRSAYNYDRNAASIESGYDNGDEPTLTKQSFKEEVDINTIVKRFNLTGQLPTDLRAPTYADFDAVFDFHSAMNAIRNAQETFYELPPELRARFHNDPQELLEFCGDEKNREEASKMGLLVPKAASPAGGGGPLATLNPDAAKGPSANPQGGTSQNDPLGPPKTPTP